MQKDIEIGCFAKHKDYQLSRKYLILYLKMEKLIMQICLCWMIKGRKPFSNREEKKKRRNREGQKNRPQLVLISQKDKVTDLLEMFKHKKIGISNFTSLVKIIIKIGKTDRQIKYNKKNGKINLPSSQPSSPN